LVKNDLKKNVPHRSGLGRVAELSHLT
jgi:hypothetical protein